MCIRKKFNNNSIHYTYITDSIKILNTHIFLSNSQSQSQN